MSTSVTDAVGPEFAAWMERTALAIQPLPPPVETLRPVYVGAWIDGEMVDATPEQLLPPLPAPHLALAALLEDLSLPTAAWCVRHGVTGAAESIRAEASVQGRGVLTIAVEAWSMGADVGPYVGAALREWRRVDGQDAEGCDVFNGGPLTTDHTAQETR